MKIFWTQYLPKTINVCVMRTGVNTLSCANRDFFHQYRCFAIYIDPLAKHAHNSKQKPHHGKCNIFIIHWKDDYDYITTEITVISCRRVLPAIRHFTKAGITPPAWNCNSTAKTRVTAIVFEATKSHSARSAGRHFTKGIITQLISSSTWTNKAQDTCSEVRVNQSKGAGTILHDVF